MLRAHAGDATRTTYDARDQTMVIWCKVSALVLVSGHALLIEHVNIHTFTLSLHYLSPLWLTFFSWIHIVFCSSPGCSNEVTGKNCINAAMRLVGHDMHRTQRSLKEANR